MSNYTLESFITFCDDMMIVNESFNFKSILSKIQTVFSKLVLLIDRKVKSMKDSKIKSILLRLLSRAKRGLSKCKSLNTYNPDIITELNREAEEIKEEYDEVVEESNSFDVEKYINGHINENGWFNRSYIVSDISRRRITDENIIKKLCIDPRIKKDFFGHFDQWKKENADFYKEISTANGDSKKNVHMLDQFKLASVAEVYDENYLLELNRISKNIIGNKTT